MQSRRFAHPNYISHQNQWRPHGPRFNPMWPMQHKNHPNSQPYNSPNNNEDHWCETCDRGFRTLDILLNHKQQHQKCNIDGCQFIAHPKVITKHIQMQHSTGLYKKIAKLGNPEEIRKWREERKKRYPTKVNIEKKKAEIKEKIDRGEKMGMKSHREYKPNKREQGLKRKCSQDINQKNLKRRFPAKKSFIEVHKKSLIDNNKKTKTLQKEDKIFPHVDDSKILKPFTGILNLLDDSDNDNVTEDVEINGIIEDDEYVIMDESNEKNNSIITEPVVCEALSSLICNYESSDEESVHTTIPLQHNKSENFNTKNNVVAQNGNVNNKILDNSVKSDDDSGPEEAKIIKTMITDSSTDIPISHIEKPTKLESSRKAVRIERQEKNGINNTKNITKKIQSKLPSTLLEKLLRNEIRQERNIVLQCIRYIVKNNFFEKI